MQVLLLAALAWVAVSVLVVSLGAAAARGDRQAPARQRTRHLERLILPERPVRSLRRRR
jgi:hypothetical protein